MHNSGYLPDRLAILAELTSIILTFAITLFLTLYICRALERDFLRGAVSPTLSELPVWIIDAALFTGLVLFLLQLLATFLKTRFANAIAAFGCKPADLSWRVGIDVLAFGAMKIGTLGADAVVAFDPATVARLRVLHKRAGLLSSKQRFLAAQLIAITDNGLWLENARRTNTLAARLGDAIAAFGETRLIAPVETNQVFCRLGENEISSLRAARLEPRRWPALGDGAYRLVVSVAHSNDDARRFLEAMSGTNNPAIGKSATIADG